MTQLYWALGFTLAFLLLSGGSKWLVIMCLALLLAMLTGFVGAWR